MMATCRQKGHVATHLFSQINRLRYRPGSNLADRLVWYDIDWVESPDASTCVKNAARIAFTGYLGSRSLPGKS